MTKETDLIEALCAGVARTRSYMDQLTDYHGGPIKTEYLLTSDLARELLDRRHKVSVEGLNRSVCTVTTSLDPAQAREKLGGMRTDLIVGDRMAPDALIEVKIRIASYTGIAPDLDKLRDTIELMKPRRQRNILGISLFQIHFASTQSRKKRAHFEKAVRGFEIRLNAKLKAREGQNKNYKLRLVDLLTNPTEGIVDQAIEEDFDGAPMLGETGHATRYYAIIMKHDIYGSPSSSNFLEMKAERAR